MTASRLRLNANKTKVQWLGSRYNVDRLTIRELNVLGSVVKIVDSARDLHVGVVVDIRLTMADHIASVCRAAYYRSSCGKFNPWCVYCRWMHQRRWSRHSPAVGWITATRYSTTSPRTFINACGRCRMRQLGSQAEHADRTVWAHHACLTTSLAACSTPCGFQADHSRVQGYAIL